MFLEVRKEARDWVRRSVEQSIRLVERKRRAAGESSEDEAARERDDDDEQGRSLDRERSLVRVEANRRRTERGGSSYKYVENETDQGNMAVERSQNEAGLEDGERRIWMEEMSN